jgi:Fe-S oxidoreductase
MISQNAKKNTDNCRFCWMCRHLCPIGLKTGKEVNTPRAKALLLSMVERGMEYDKDIAQAMYECVLCGACTNDCATGFDPLIYIREARTAAAVDEFMPPGAAEILRNIETSGNIFGKVKPSYKAQGGGDVLLYIGEVAAIQTPELINAMVSLLNKAGIKFSILEKELPSGTFMGDLIGFVEETRKQAKACAELINGTGAKTLVVLDPWEAATMIQRYPEWGCEINAQVKTATAFIADLLEQDKLKPTKTNGELTYHDSSRLARDLDEHQPARFILERMGYKIKEMFQNRRLAKCSGNSLLKAYAPELARLTAEGRWEDMERTGVDTLVTACPESYDVLSLTVPKDKKLADLFMLLDKACSK